MPPQALLPDAGLYKMIFEFAPALAAAVAILVILLGVLGRMFGFSAIGDKSKLVDGGAIDGINSKLSSIEGRITKVEHEIESRPTRAEIHALEIGVVKLDGRMGTFEENMKAVRHTVNRIDDFLLAISERSIRDGGR